MTENNTQENGPTEQTEGHGTMEQAAEERRQEPEQPAESGKKPQKHYWEMTDAEAREDMARRQAEKRKVRVILPDQTITPSTVGYYGMRRFDYLRENDRDQLFRKYVNELLEDELASLNERCEAREDQLRLEIMARHGVTEKMLETDWYRYYLEDQSARREAREMTCEEFGIDRP